MARTKAVAMGKKSGNGKPSGLPSKHIGPNKSVHSGALKIKDIRRRVDSKGKSFYVLANNSHTKVDSALVTKLSLAEDCQPELLKRRRSSGLKRHNKIRRIHLAEIGTVISRVSVQRLCRKVAGAVASEYHEINSKGDRMRPEFAFSGKFHTALMQEGHRFLCKMSEMCAKGMLAHAAGAWADELDVLRAKLASAEDKFRVGKASADDVRNATKDIEKFIEKRERKTLNNVFPVNMYADFLADQEAACLAVSADTIRVSEHSRRPSKNVDHHTTLGALGGKSKISDKGDVEQDEE